MVTLRCAVRGFTGPLGSLGSRHTRRPGFYRRPRHSGSEIFFTWIQIFFARYNISTMFIIYIRYVFAQIWKNIYHFKNIFMARNRRLEISTVILCGETLAFHHSACWQDTTWPLQRYWTLCESHLIVRTKVHTSSTSSTYSHHSDSDLRGTWFNSFSWYANGWVMQQDKPALTSLFDTPFCQSNII